MVWIRRTAPDVESCRTAFRARDSLDFAAATEMPSTSAISSAEYSRSCRSSTTSRKIGGKRRIALLSNSSFSRLSQ